MSNSVNLRELILREAEQALLQQGFFGVSLRQVAFNTGVHPGTVGALFGGKKGLLKAAEERLRQNQEERLAS
jgi:AcrR family transcriptional regulator